MSLKIKLVSFALCPFVQRSVILLREKQVVFELEYIDLDQPPEWFLRLSPTGKVPLLLVDDAVLFESSVILDFLDERFPPRFHPADILKRAQHKSWIEYGSTLLMGMYGMAMATDRETFIEKKASLERDIERLAEPLESGLFGEEGVFSLVDAAIAPLFMRLHYHKEFHQEGEVQMPASVSQWAARLLNRPSVQASVVDDFADRYGAFLVEKKSWLLMQSG
ncbi:MAG: glutathione S-transferase family protein [Candidatus Thiodiazotropha sp. 6PLUC1]